MVAREPRPGSYTGLSGQGRPTDGTLAGVSLTYSISHRSQGAYLLEVTNYQ